MWQGSGAYVRRAHWEADGSWSIECGDGSVATARLTPSGCCYNALILLNFELTRRGSRSLVLLNDSLPAETGRRLSTRLRRLKRL